MAGLAKQFLASVALSLNALPVASQAINFGDDASPFANNGVCDDIRFIGPGMANNRTPKSRVLEAARRMMADGNRYESERAMEMYERGLSEQTMLDERAAERALTHVRHDSTDCHTAYEKKQIQLRR